ncbi:MAG: hypothetical protein A3K77_04615 [Euryarchaeota archaeon RBG_13_31_8]|nr:MAG: hypothetical protein A3K77_04615 [Euryarchaeota archaeon RBG_13_31_8]
MSELEQRMNNIEQRIEEINEKLDILTKAILGDAIDSTQIGILRRLERLEQSYKTLSKLFWLLCTALGTAIGTLIANQFMKIY